MSDDLWLEGSDSPSKRWRIEWVDGSGSSRGRARVLHDGKEVRRLADVERPQDAAVGDDGSVVVFDATVDAPGRPKYRAALILYPANGTPSVHRFRANPDRMFISYKTDLVVGNFCDTAEEDEVKVARFRLSTGVRIYANEWPR